MRRGEIVGLYGLVGAGRTELAKSIMGFVPPIAGTVEIDGKPVRDRERRRRDPHASASAMSARIASRRA